MHYTRAHIQMHTRAHTRKLAHTHKHTRTYVHARTVCVGGAVVAPCGRGVIRAAGRVSLASLVNVSV